MNLTFKSKTDKGGRVSYEARQDGWLFVMTHRLDASLKTRLDLAVATRQPVDVMIIGPLGSHVAGLTVDMVTEDYELISHNGFECSGSMCSTTAYAEDKPGQTVRGMLTPGRCEMILPVADNVNARFDKRPETPRTPGRVYVRKGEYRAAGVPTLDEVCKKAHAQCVAHKKNLAKYRAEGILKAA